MNLGNEVANEWQAKVTRWAHLCLPNAQIDTAWKENDKILEICAGHDASRSVHYCLHDIYKLALKNLQRNLHIEFAEVQFYFCAKISLTTHALALFYCTHAWTLFFS